MRITLLLFLALTLSSLSADAYDLAKVPEACAVVGKDDALKIAGESISDPKQEKPVQSDQVKVTQCTYPSADGSKSMSLLVRISNAKDNNPGYAKQTLK